MPSPERETSPAPAWFVHGALGLWLVGLLLRLGATRHTTVISRDGITYLELAGRALAGDADGLLGAHYPPGFPVVLALLAGPFGLSETSGALASAAASALVVPAITLLAGRAHGRAAGLCAGLLAAVLPELVTIGGEVLSDGTYMALLAWTLVLLQRLHERGGARAGLGAAVLGGLAYLTRPEALVVLGGAGLGLLALPRPQDRRSPRRRLVDLLWLAAPGLLAVVPYLLVLRDNPVIGGVEGAGTFKLTAKQDLPQLLQAASPARLAAHVARLLARVVVVLAPVAPFVLLAAWSRSPVPGHPPGTPGAWARAPLPGPRGPARRLGALLAVIGAPLLLAFAVVRPDPRFGDQLALLVTPAAGLGLAWALRAWRRHRGPAWLPALALLLVCLPFGLRDRHERKATYRDLGALLAEERARSVLSEDSRAAFYAGARSVWLPPDAQDDPAAIVSLAARGGVDALVLVARTPEQEATSRAVSDLLEQTPWKVERRGADTLHVFWVR